MGKKTYPSIDVIKIIMAIVVVAIHTKPLDATGVYILDSLYSSVLDMAVPFFFVSLGFLLSEKLDFSDTAANNFSVLRHHILKLIKMYFIWSLIYLPLAVIPYFDTGGTVFHWTLVYLKDLLFVGKHYKSEVLWYLLSSIYSFGLIYILLKMRIKKSIVVTICMALYFAAVFFCDFAYASDVTVIARIGDLCRFLFVSSRVFSGLLYIPTGILISCYKPKTSTALILLVAGVTLNMWAFPKTISVFRAILAAGFFVCVLTIKLKDRYAYKVVRGMSTVIFLIHEYVWVGFYYFVYGEETYGIRCFIFTAIISAVTGYTYVRLRDLRKSHILLT